MSNKSQQSSNAKDPPSGGDETTEKLTELEIHNFVDSVETLNVIVQRPIAGWKHSHTIAKESFTLPSEGTKGLALLINIVKFEDDITNVSRRYGSEHDLDYLTDLLIQLEYKLYPSVQSIRERKHKSKKVIETQIQTFKTLCTEQRPQSIIVFIGSHGSHPNKIVTSDRKRMDIYEDVVYKFTQDPNFTVLEEKPKIFLVQACQSYYSNGASLMAHATIHQSPPTMIKDVYICTSTTPGKASMRDIYKGSWFPYCFTYMMMKHALKMKSLQEIMELVRNMMGQIKDYQEFKQVPSTISGSYDKPLYFVKSDYIWNGVRNYDENLSWLEGASKFCIICTIDPQITCEKVTENLSQSSIRLHEWADFPEFLLSDRCRLEEGVVDVVIGCTLSRFELYLRKLDTIKRQQIIFITDVDKQSILNLDPNLYFLDKVDVKVDPMSFDDLSLPYQVKIMERLERKYGICLAAEELKGELLVDLITGKELYKDEIKPRQLRYYVPRMLLTRNIISDELFEKKHSNDIFLIRGIQRRQLSSIVKKQMTGRAQDNLEKITVNFMTLEKDSHFDTICKNTSKAVHMLYYENGKFIWIQTRGSIKVVQKHVANNQEEQTEEDFCSLICAHSGAPVCISDSPGMGKTILLAQIGKRLRRMFPDRTVLFVELSTFIQRVTNEAIPTYEIHKDTIVKVLQDTVCKTLLARHILESTLNSYKLSVELLFDGFDEVKVADSDPAHEILKNIRSSFASIRMWVTSRPHKLEELEITLGGLGYNIKPFTETDQVNFLERFWLQHTKKRNTKRIRNFARHCLGSLKRKMNSNEQDIAGIPLQCYLIGELYEERALEHAELDSTSPFPQDIFISSIATLYQKVIEKKVAIYRSKFGPHGSPKDSEISRYAIVKWLESLYGLSGKLFGKGPSQKERQELNEAQLNNLHTHLGTCIIFPDLFQELNHSFDPQEMDELLNVGIWELAGGTEPRVLHRTFAEYFAALFIRDKLVGGNGWGEVLSKFFVGNVLLSKESKSNPIKPYGNGMECKVIDFTSKVDRHKALKFIYPVVIYFLNSLLTPDPAIEDANPILTDVANGIKDSVNNSQLSQIVYALAYADCDNILKLLEKIGLFADQTTASAIFNKEFISCAIKHSGVEVIRLGFSHYEQHHQNEFDLELKGELLHLAVERGQDAQVEFLINEQGLRPMVEKLHDETRLLFHKCLVKTVDETDAEIDQRIEILGMLDEINKELKEERDWVGNTPLLVMLVYMRLRIELIRLGADVTAQGKHMETILHGGNCFVGGTYHTLVKMIHEMGKLKELVHMESDYRTPLLDIMRTFDPLPETLEFFATAGADFNHKSKNGWSALMHAVSCNRSISTLQCLIELGADLAVKGNDGDTLLHLAADKGINSVTTLEFLVKDHGMDVNAMNDHGQTPLDIVLEQQYRTNRYFEVGLTIFELGGRNNTYKDSLCRWSGCDIIEYEGVRMMVATVGHDWREDSVDVAAKNTVDCNKESLEVSMLLLQIYLFGPEGVESGKCDMPSPHPLNYEYLKALLIDKGAKERGYGAIGRLHEIMHNTIGRNEPPIWDADTIQKFQAGELICHFKMFPT